ncbi:MAG: DUF554 domain-containing protein [Cellulosilyticaceae bacterium]
MILLGTIVNVVLIIVGGIIGALTKRGIPKRFSDLIMCSIGLVTTVIGITFAIETQNILIVIASLVIGGILGEWINIDAKLNQLGERVKGKIKGEQSNVGEGFVTATLLFCVGSMAIMGSLDSGIRGDHAILYTKSVMDGISALLFASSMGAGVVLAAVPVLLYQGAITLLAGALEPFLSAALITEMSAVGGILLIGLGLSVLEIKKIKVANLLPAIFLPVIIMTIM